MSGAAGDLREREPRLGGAGEAIRLIISVSSASWIVSRGVTACQLVVTAASSSIGVGMKAGLSSLRTIFEDVFSIFWTFSAGNGLFAVGLIALLDL